MEPRRPSRAPLAKPTALAPAPPASAPMAASAALQLCVPIPRLRHASPLTQVVSAPGVARPRPRTSTERGQRYRAKRKEYETALKQEIKAIRDEVDRLRCSRSIWSQKALLSRASPSGSLVLLTRELYTLFKHGLEDVDAATIASLPIDAAARKLSAMQYKENFLHRVLDPEVDCGDLVGVDAVISQWKRHTASYSKFELEIGGVETVTGSEANPIVVIRTTLHARFSRDRISGTFPLALSRHADLVDKLVDRDLEFACVSRFQFSESGQIVTYMLDIDFVGSLLRVLGNTRDVAELMHWSLLTRYATLMDEYRYEEVDTELVSDACVSDDMQELKLFRYEDRSNGDPRLCGHNDGEDDEEMSPGGTKLSLRYLLTEEQEEQKGDPERRDTGSSEPLGASRMLRRPGWHFGGAISEDDDDGRERESDAAGIRFMSF